MTQPKRADRLLLVDMPATMALEHGGAMETRTAPYWTRSSLRT